MALPCIGAETPLADPWTKAILASRQRRLGADYRVLT